MKALVAQKIGMTSVIGDNGEAIAVTLLRATPNTLVQTKSMEKNGYNALALGSGEVSKEKAGKAQTGQYKPAKIIPKIVREFRVDDLPQDLNVGDKINADVFSVGDQVDVTGITKGKGFAGTIKRHNFQRGRKTHGGRSYRRPGSIGSMYPQKIFKGKKMAGRMGHDQVTTKRLKVALIEPELNVIGITGAVPGPRKGLIMIRETK